MVVHTAQAAPDIVSPSRAPFAAVSVPANETPRVAPTLARLALAQSSLSDFDATNWSFLDDVSLLDKFALDCPTLRFVPKTR